jgi:hypothetical protein
MTAVVSQFWHLRAKGRRQAPPSFLPLRVTDQYLYGLQLRHILVSAVDPSAVKHYAVEEVEQQNKMLRQQKGRYPIYLMLRTHPGDPTSISQSFFQWVASHPEATTAISNHLGSDARQLMIMPSHSIIVYLRDGKGHALGFNSSTKFAGEFRADIVRKVEPQPEVPLKVAIAIRDLPVDIMTCDRHVHRCEGVFALGDLSDDGREFIRFESDSPELGPAYPQLHYKAQDYIIIFFKKDVSGYGLNLRTGGIGQFMARDMHCIPPTDRPKPVSGEPKGTRREAVGGKQRPHREFELPFIPPMDRPKPVGGEPKGTRRGAAGGKQRPHREFESPYSLFDGLGLMR